MIIPFLLSINPKFQEPTIYLGSEDGMALYCQLNNKLSQDGRQYKVSITFQSEIRRKNYSNRIINTSTVQLGMSGLSFSPGSYCIGDFIGGQRIPQVFVQTIYSASYGELLKYDDHKVYTLVALVGTNISSWPAQSKSGQYEIKARYYSDFTVSVQKAMAKGAPRPVENLVITGAEIMNWWQKHGTPYGEDSYP